jgi:hypothetical protein
MPPAKLSGSLLVRKDARMPATPADDLSAMNHDADGKTLGGPVLVWSTRPETEAEPHTNKDQVQALRRATVDLDPSANGVVAAPVSQSGRLGRHASALRSTGLPAVAVAASLLAIGSVSGPLFLHPNGVKIFAETALSTASEKLASRDVEPDAQPPVITAAAVSPPAASDPAAGSAADAAATPPGELPNHPSTGEPGAVRVAAVQDPAVPGDAPPVAQKDRGVTPGAGTDDSSSTPAEGLASTKLNSALLARGDGLFVLGDLSSARMLYERAANAGHGLAALRLGESYDPAFLARARFISARADAAVAAYWYQRARELGAPGADILLAAIAAEAGHSSP